MTFRNSAGQIYTNLSSINFNICKFLDGLSLDAGSLGTPVPGSPFTLDAIRCDFGRLCISFGSQWMVDV